jgi:Family of unknown function (DUF6446)
VNGKIIGGFLVLTGLVAGIAMYWLQVYAFYEDASFIPGAEITLTPIIGDQPEAIIANDLRGIDADSSPLRFRACFTTPTSLATLTETYRNYDAPTPLIAPGWFDCFDANAIGEALEKGEAIAFLSQFEIIHGFDRVVAVFPDGRAYAWHQMNNELED